MPLASKTAAQYVRFISDISSRQTHHYSQPVKIPQAKATLGVRYKNGAGHEWLMQDGSYLEVEESVTVYRIHSASHVARSSSDIYKASYLAACQSKAAICFRSAALESCKLLHVLLCELARDIPRRLYELSFHKIVFLERDTRHFACS